MIDKSIGAIVASRFRISEERFARIAVVLILGFWRSIIRAELEEQRDEDSTMVRVERCDAQLPAILPVFASFAESAMR
jgi:hypothetical protein